ncbi:MAG: lipid A export permease/ATP-binding protein MsbA [Burkholderiaceae bacterium]
MTPPSPPLKARLARIAPFFRNSGKGFVVAIIGLTVGAATEPVIPEILQYLLDTGFKPGGLPSLWLIPVWVIGLFSLRGLAGFVAQYGLAWAANRGMLALRESMFGRLLDADAGLFSRTSASSLINTLTFEVQNGANQLVYSIQSLVRDSLTVVALLGYLMWKNWQLTLFVAILFPAVAFAMRVLSKRLHRLNVESQRATDALAYVVEENVLAWRIVRLHDAGPSQARRFHALSDRLRGLSVKAVVAAAAMTPITQVLTACTLSAVIVVAMWQSGRTGGTAGEFVSFVAAMLMVVSPIKHLSEVAGPITRGLAALDKGVSLIDTSPAEAGGSFDPGRGRGQLELRDIGLRYRDDQAPALEAVSFELRAGETVALVGPSGAGKSTLVNLLPRFLEPTAGSLLLDGTPVTEWNIHALRRQFALVSQDVVLFNDTVAANVALGATIDRERVNEALRGANLIDFARSLPEGIDSMIGHNGGQLSGGQRQRLAIARAIYKDAPILILDEATSALDSESERLVQQALEVLMHGRTRLVIAHRLSTIERADRIITLDAGRVVEQGSHAELLARGGLYARLHALQFRST